VPFCRCVPSMFNSYEVQVLVPNLMEVIVSRRREIVMLYER
jgi:hypothetical protein